MDFFELAAADDELDLLELFVVLSASVVFIWADECCGERFLVASTGNGNFVYHFSLKIYLC